MTALRYLRASGDGGLHDSPVHRRKPGVDPRLALPSIPEGPTADTKDAGRSLNELQNKPRHAL